MDKTRTIVLSSLLIAVEIVLTRYLSYQSEIIRISFGFLPIAIAAMLFGPVTGGICAALGDVIGMLLFPKGAYFPGFTLSAFCTGFIYGLFLHKRKISIPMIVFAVILVIGAIDIGMNTVWLMIITGKAYQVLIIPRVVKSLAMLPIQIALIFTVAKVLKREVRFLFVE